MPSEHGEALAKKVITFQQLAEFVVLSPRQLQRLAKDGVISLAKDKRGRLLRGRVILGQALPRLFAYARESAGDPAVARFRRARADISEAQASMAQIELETKRGEYLPRATVDFFVTQSFSGFKHIAMALPSRVVHSLVGQTDVGKIHEIVMDAIRDMLERCAEFRIPREASEEFFRSGDNGTAAPSGPLAK